MRFHVALLLASVLTPACSSADFAVREGESVEDSAAAPDVIESDTSVAPDTNEPLPFDAAEPDTASEPDTATAPDTERPDVAPVDTGSCLCPMGTECQVSTCTAGVCGLMNKGYGTPCSGGKCDGVGKCVQCNAASDCGASTECKTVSCVSNKCVFAPNTGARCSGTGYCSSTGACVQCLDATHCPASTNECKQAVCNAGTCAFAPKPSGTFCKGFEDQCDGAGNCVDCVNSGGCGECCTCSPSHTCVPA